MSILGWLFLAVAALSLIAIIWAISAPASKVALVLTVLGTCFYAFIAIQMWRENQRLGRATRVDYYSLSVRPEGLQSIHLNSISEVPGLSVRPVPKGFRRQYHGGTEYKLPVSFEDVVACGWKIQSPKIKLHLHDAACGCGPKDDLLDTGFDERFRDGTFDGIDLEYKVDEHTRGVLEAIDLEVTHPFTYGNDVAMGTAFGGCIGTVAWIGTLLGLVGAACQGWRLLLGVKGSSQIPGPISQSGS